MLLDTDFLIDLTHGHEAAVERVGVLLASAEPAAVSAITVLQLHQGVPRVRAPATERRKVTEALRGFATYPVTHEIAARGGELDGELVARGRRVDLADVLIAATALHHDEPVLTRNRRHFERFPGLRVVTY